ncbi:MAG: hypothetical protein ACK58N_20250 [Synechocystis sp.]
MADQSPSPNSPLLSQLQATLDQLETVVQQLDADPTQRQSLRDETLTRLQSTLDSLQKMRGSSPGQTAAGGVIDGQTSEWDELFVDSFPVQTPVPPVPQPVVKSPVERRSRRDPLGDAPSVSPTPRSPRRQKPKFGILSAIATGLLGILVGIVLWIGIPSLDLPPLWDQIASRIPPLPMTPTVEPPRPDLPSSEGIVESDAAEGELPPVLEAPAPPTAIAIEPLPEAPLTPEQSLLAVIQQELIDLEGLYPPQLIQRIEPDFLVSRLTLTIGANWQQLSAKQQQTLLDTLWQRAQKLSFAQLRLYAPDGDLIARSPVVGQQMVVLQSAEPLAEQSPDFWHDSGSVKPNRLN